MYGPQMLQTIIQIMLNFQLQPTSKMNQNLKYWMHTGKLIVYYWTQITMVCLMKETILICLIILVMSMWIGMDFQYIGIT